MRTQLVFLLSLLLFALPAFPQLKLTTKILQQKYCPGDVDLDALVLDLGLRFTNEGSQKIILSREHSQINELIVWKNEKGKPGEQQLRSYLEWMTEGGREITPDDLDKLFVVLLPRESYEIKAEARLFVRRDGRSEIGGSIGSGDKFLQVYVSNSSTPKLRTDFLSDRWKDKGFLWTQSVLSEPMNLTIVPNRTLKKCP